MKVQGDCAVRKVEGTGFFGFVEVRLIQDEKQIKSPSVQKQIRNKRESRSIQIWKDRIAWYIRDH